MSTRRLSMLRNIPFPVRRVFHTANRPVSGEEAMWRERAARMTLDALGYTNLTRKIDEHNDAIVYARRWFSGVYDNHEDPKRVDNALATFDCAGLEDHFEIVRDCVLSRRVSLMRPTESIY